MHYFINILLILEILNAHLFSNTIKGKVTSANIGEPLPGVNVIVENTFLGSSTNIDGTYEIKNVPPGKYFIQAIYVGYCSESDSINLDSSTTEIEHNFILKQSFQKIELEYSEKYKEYHNNIEKAISNTDTTFILILNEKIIKNTDCIVIYPQIQNNYYESIYFPDRIDFYSVYINGQEFDKIETIYRFGCPMHFFSKTFKEDEIIEIKPDSVGQIAGFFICYQDIEDSDLKEIDIKLKYKFDLPEFTYTENCYFKNISAIKDRYLKLFNAEIVSKELIIKFN